MRGIGEHVRTIAVTALVTALAAAALFWTGPVVANDGKKQEIPWPTLKADGVEITLRAQKTAYKAGEQPVVELVAYNPTNATATIRATVQMMSMQQPNFASRIALPTQKSWETECELLLAAGERKTVRVTMNPVTAAASGLKLLNANGTQVQAQAQLIRNSLPSSSSQVAFVLKVGKEQVATRFLTVEGAAAGATALAQAAPNRITK